MFGGLRDLFGIIKCQGQLCPQRLHPGDEHPGVGDVIKCDHAHFHIAGQPSLPGDHHEKLPYKTLSGGLAHTWHVLDIISSLVDGSNSFQLPIDNFIVPLRSDDAFELNTSKLHLAVMQLCLSHGLKVDELRLEQPLHNLRALFLHVRVSFPSESKMVEPKEPASRLLMKDVSERERFAREWEMVEEEESLEVVAESHVHEATKNQPTQLPADKPVPIPTQRSMLTQQQRDALAMATQFATQFLYDMANRFKP